MSDTPQHTNRLAQESSPYLLQHAHNPVDWHPWGPEAFAKARAEDKPVLVSIGYAACHWCHVMERESFEDEAIARRQNDLFVNIKVDREERPDLDEIYMEAVQLLRGQGGWPLNAFCLPDGRPFYGGTYFPPQRRMGLPSWLEVLESVATAYHDRRDQVLQGAVSLLEHLGRAAAIQPAASAPDPAEALRAAAALIMENFDGVHGGFGSAPKFPQPFYLRLLLHCAADGRNAQARDQALFTLRKMAEGGMYDHLGGGFHRYAVDQEWLVPHFEKMLYDNALLPPLYVDAFRLTGDPFFRRIAEETLDYLLRDMRSPQGAFYSSTDADSEGEEGKFFVWSPAETERLLGKDDAAILNRYYDVTPHGNFEGHSILHPTMAVAEVARWHQRSVEEVEAILARGRGLLLAARAQRVPPPTDTKVIVAWNGLALHALAYAGAILEAPRFLDAAEQAATFLLTALRTDRGLFRIYAGGRASVPAFLEDYAALADGLFSLYEATANERWFTAALALTDEMLVKFWDATHGGFFTTGPDNEPLIARSKPTYDGATPSGNSHAARVLARAYALTARGDYADRLESMARTYAVILERAPVMMSLLVTSWDWAQRHQAVAIVGDPAAPDTRALVRAVHGGWYPYATVIRRISNDSTVVPQLEGKTAIDGRSAVYVCRGVTCSPPVTTPEALTALLTAPA